MEQFMGTYRNNVDDIENFLVESIRNVGNLSIKIDQNFDKLFTVFPSLELVYVCDKESLNQISPNIYRDKTSEETIGRNRKYLLNKIHFNETGVSVSQPYISSATGVTCVAVARLENDKIFFMDFNVTVLLQRLGLVEIYKQFNLLSKSFYLITANVMILLAVFTVGYSFFEFINALFFKTGLSIESIFKPVIALTLGLAIFDLAKTILEQRGCL